MLVGSRNIQMKVRVDAENTSHECVQINIKLLYGTCFPVPASRMVK